MEDVAGRAIRATVPWMVVQGRGLGEVGVRLDAVSIPMLAVVCLVALAVQVYSIAYMHGETGPLLRPVLRVPRALPLQHEPFVSRRTCCRRSPGGSSSAS